MSGRSAWSQAGPAGTGVADGTGVSVGGTTVGVGEGEGVGVRVAGTRVGDGDCVGVVGAARAVTGATSGRAVALDATNRRKLRL